MLKFLNNSLVILLVISLTSTLCYSQDLFNNKNLSQIKVDQLSESEVLKLQSQLRSANISITEAEQIAISKGMSVSEFAKLKTRLESINTISNPQSTQNNTSNSTAVRNYVPINDQIVSNQNAFNDKIFGSELFKSNSLSFEPNLHLATPPNYILGPDDGILINVYGLQEVTFNQTISPEGTIYIPTVGIIHLAGLTIMQANSVIKSKMSQIGYKSLRSGRSQLNISLTKIRSITITIMGAVKSGTYTISSLSTLFNALYLSGGPSTNRSFRNIELIRNNSIFKKVDLYHFLLTGDESDNVSLRDNDIIRLPIYLTRVEIDGQVKRPGIFEMAEGEKLSDLLTFASGFTDTAYRASMKVIQLTNKERRVKSLESNEFSNYTPLLGDHFIVSQLLNRYENRVTISGAVFRPGIFEMTPGLTVSKLIKNAEGLKEDAFLQRGQILRLKEDNTSEIVSFDVSKALLGGSDDILLKREDSVIISSVFDLRDKYTVQIEGEVRRPGNYLYKEGLSLKDLIIQAGGFTYAAYPQRIEIARLIKRNIISNNDSRLNELIDVENLNDLSLEAQKNTLQPYDVVIIRRLPNFRLPQTVEVSGEVQYPGPYILSTTDEKITDVLKKAGGFLPEAYPEGAYLKRSNKTDSNQNLSALRVKSIQRQLNDSTGSILTSVTREYDQIPLDLNNILANPNSEYNLILKPGDQLFIPRNDQEIRISGEVFFPTKAPFVANRNIRGYINSAGGFTENAKRKKAYLLYPNGKAVATHHFLFIHNYPIVHSGAEVIVPRKSDRKKLSTAETIGISSALASLAGVVIAIIQLTKK